MLINVGFEAPLLLDPLHGGGCRGGGRGGGGKLLVFLKAQKGLVWERVEARRGREEKAGRQLSNIRRREQRGGTSDTGRRTGLFFSSHSRIIFPTSPIQSRDFLPAPFHHRMSCGNIPALRLDQECFTPKWPNHHPASSPMQAAPPASSALQRRELPLTQTARRLQPGKHS